MAKYPEVKKSRDGTGMELGKRCYLPYIVSDKCPTCGEVVQKCLVDDYLSYPREGEPYDMYMMHVTEQGEECCEWKIRVVVRMTLDLV